MLLLVKMAGIPIYNRTINNLHLTEIKISQIEGIRRRVDLPTDIDSIAKSFSKHGQFSPIRVRKHPSKEGMYEVIFGSRRLATAKSLGWKTIIADLVEASDTEALIMAFSENEDREKFTDYEKALLLEKLHLVSGKSYSEVAEIVGRSPSYVSQHIAMLHLFPKGIVPDEVSKIVLQQLTEKHARTLLRIEDPKERWATAKLAVKATMGVRELERMVSNSNRRTFEPNRASSQTGIKQIIKYHIEALNSRDIGSHFAAISKKHFSKFSYFPPFSKLDWMTANEHLLGMLHDLRSYGVTVESLELRVVGKIAYAVATLHNHYANSAKTVTTETSLTIILEEEQSDWKIVHEHWSTASPARFLSLFTNEQFISKKIR